MRRALLAGFLLTAVGAGASADRIVLVDGRTFTGAVTVEADTVVIAVPYGTLRFPRDQVERIDLKDTPEQEYSKRLADISLDDANAVFQLAEWAEEHSLPDRANDLYAQVIRLNGDHRLARQRLGFVRIDGKWLPFDSGLELARSKLDAGLYSALLHDVIPELKLAARAQAKLLAVEDLQAHTLLRAEQFEEAGKAFAALAKQAGGAAAVRDAAIAGILADNADGMYVLRKSYPPTTPLMSTGQPAIQPGPASLATPKVLEAALHDLARRKVDAGQALVEEAQKLEPTDADGANARYAQALKVFDLAEALCPGVTRPNRIEIARRKIAVFRKDADADARQFDEAMKRLGQHDLTPLVYRNMLLRLVHHLDSTRDDLKRILDAARAYPDELVLEIKWAELDLTKVEGMRKILQAEIDGKK